MAAKLIDIRVSGRQHIDRYELIGEIASGGMATVYLGRLTGVGGFQRMFAIKRLHPHLAGDKEFVEMFLDEARLAAGIHHPNVVPILEVGASNVGYYIVMEYIEGDTLARLLARTASQGHRLPAPVVIRIVLDMLAGLHAAHELRDETGAPTNLVHRDVSPQNVLVGADGVARITDFGVARAASRLSDTRVGQLKGKIAYMAPEQASGVEDMDRRADIFAAGIVLWEALAGRRLFKAENEAATLSRVMSEPIPSLTTLANLEPRLNAVIMKALERDVDKRFSTCAQFADALEAAAVPVKMIASSRDLSNYVANVLGAEIAQQKDAVRAWIAQSGAESSGAITPGSFSRPGRPSSVSGGAMSLHSLTPPPLSDTPSAVEYPERKQSRGFWLAALLLLFGLGTVAFIFLRPQASPSVSVGDSAPAPTIATAVEAPPEVVSSVAPTETPGETAAPTPSATASEVVPEDPKEPDPVATAATAQKPPVWRPRPRKPAPEPTKPPPSEAPVEKKPESGGRDLSNPYR